MTHYYGAAANIIAGTEPDIVARAMRQDGYKFHGAIVASPSVIRWSQGLQSWTEPNLYHSATDFLIERARQRTTHLQYLASLGINIPNYSSFISCSPFEPEAPVLLDRVEFVNGTDIPEDGASEILRYLGSTLRKYLSWCERRPDASFMSDVFDPGQYVISDHNTVNLVDIEPLFSTMRADADTYAQSLLEDAYIYIDHYEAGEH